ncbi:MAG TPA: hypothetical protein VGN07_12955 [Steroidobacteraceae bacterium]|jgi:hypothetical protein
MHDGTSLITVVAGVSFLLLMELSRLGVFSGAGQAIHAEFAPRQQAVEQPAASATPATDSAAYVHVAVPRAAGPHQLRSRERPGDRA